MELCFNVLIVGPFRATYLTCVCGSELYHRYEESYYLFVGLFIVLWVLKG